MDARNDWKNIEALPSKDDDGWSIWKTGHKTDMELPEVRSLVERWLPANPLLIGAPGAVKYLPPVLVSEFEDAALRVVRNNYRTMSLALVTCGIILLAVAASRPASEVFTLGLLSFALGAATATDYYFGLRTRDGLAERALFFYWLKTDPSARMGFLVWLAIALGVGALQLLLQWQLVGMDEVFHGFGTMYADVRAGQYWRLLTGPYFHYSLLHYLNNAILLLFAGTMASALLGRSAFAMFVLGNTFTAIAQMMLGGNAFDNYGGISGGVYTLLGMLIAAGAGDRQLLAKGLWLLILNLTVLGMFASEALSGHSATAAHLSGLLFGGLVGVSCSSRERTN